VYLQISLLAVKCVYQHEQQLHKSNETARQYKSLLLGNLLKLGSQK